MARSTRGRKPLASPLTFCPTDVAHHSPEGLDDDNKYMSPGKQVDFFSLILIPLDSEY